MGNAGQICTATSRLLVHSSIVAPFTAKLQEAIKTTSKLGDPFEPSTSQGPQVSKTQYERVLSYIEAGKREGATVATGGTPAPEAGGKGFFISPTIFTGTKPSMSIYKEEIFGPVVVTTAFETEDEALRLANDTTYGLGAAVFTRDIERAHCIAARLDAGTVWINSSNDSDIRVPFGGVKQSGIGRELGEEGLRAYSTVKSVHVNLGQRL